MREYYDQWESFSATLSWKGRIKEGARRQADSRRRPLSAHEERAEGVRAVAHDCGAACSGGAASNRSRCIRRLRSAPYRCDGYGDYIFAVSRLAPLKRLSLLVDALATPGARRAFAASLRAKGKSTTRSSRRSPRRGCRRASRCSAGSTISQMLDHLARCRAVCFPPYDEDYGFVTVEAFASRKAVVTCSDSGGPAELVVRRRQRQSVRAARQRRWPWRCAS